jgi:hypothetical protein
MHWPAGKRARRERHAGQSAPLQKSCSSTVVQRKIVHQNNQHNKETCDCCATVTPPRLMVGVEHDAALGYS